jgi:hypothetical protein
MKLCPSCETGLVSTQLSCPACHLRVEGSFTPPRLARLKPLTQALAEEFILTGGNLKELGARLEISYPTVRRRIDEMIAELGALREADEKRIEQIIGRIERKEITPEEGTRQIKEINNGF